MHTTPLRAKTASLALVAFLAACGGGDTPGSEPQTRARASNVAATLDTAAIPPDAFQKGMFGPVTTWPMIPMHVALLADGRVLSFGTRATGQASGFFNYDVWDSDVGLSTLSHLTMPNNTATDTFCASVGQLADGAGVVISGGDLWTGTAISNRGNNNSLVFKLSDNSLTRGADMALARWYGTSTVLLNGEMMIQGGIDANAVPAAYSEVRGADGSYRALNGFSTSGLGYSYPRNFVVSDGRVFGFDIFGNMYYVNAAGNGAIVRYNTQFTGPKGAGSSAVMYQPGKILQLGGTSNEAIIIDVSGGGAPVVTPTQSMAAQRLYASATLLPNGKVLATGGSRVDNQLTDVVYTAELWDPATGQWTAAATAVKARLYHSTALLLRDGSVMVGGGGAPGPQINTNVEIYYPSYLFTASGALAARPAIVTAPTVTGVGSTIRVDINSARPISRVTLLRTGAATHSFNSEQRFSELTFVPNGSQLSIQMPTQAGHTPPGMYMLFALDDAGVPSAGHMIRINVAPSLNPAFVPVLALPATQSSPIGQAASLQLQASDPNNDVLTFNAAGLPPGLGIDGASGLISGTPTQPGTFAVTVTASDGINAASQIFSWVITGVLPPLSVAPAPGSAPTFSLVGTQASFSAVAAGTGIEYSWTFGDASAATAWSSSGVVQHTFASPGGYVVSVTARDVFGRTALYSFLQSVAFPALAGRASSSSALVTENRGSGGYRIWMVNQDNDTVSVFDGSTRARLAEITVGKSPRSLALAANGQMWVTNKLASSVSVIDVNTWAVLRTIGLGSGTRPHGVVMSPDGTIAYIALEATGRVLRLTTATNATTGTLLTGSNPRHLSLNASGSELLVARFVSPLQPGESTVNVASSLNGVATGGEVWMVNAATMALVQKVVLAHSTQADSEISARGVPNYLGAPAISPDGSQAWIPSKQDNILRGGLRDGNALNFQNTVRAIVSRVNLGTRLEDAASRVDLDNSSLASAAVFDSRGVYLFVALETSREIAVIDAHRRVPLFRVDAGRAPQSLSLSPDGNTLLVENFMDRTLGAYDLRPLTQQGLQSLPALAPVNAIAVEKLAATVLTGKQHFYDARDPRLARDSYMSCASCHNDGGHDGRVWDLTSQGEGLRRTISLRGKGKDGGHGFRHWTGNFDEIQDFEGQIRSLAGGTGLMSDAQFNNGTVAQPLGDTKAGRSSDLDALAAYVNSLNAYDNSPTYPWGAVPAPVAAGKELFKTLNCAACHGGTAFSSSGSATLHNIGTLKASSGKRLNATLTGIDPPTLRGLFAQDAFLHDGSAPTIEAAVQAHAGTALDATQLSNLGEYLRTIGSEEAQAGQLPGSGTGLAAQYFANLSLSGTPALTRTEAIDLSWIGVGPGAGIPADNWSARWSGSLEMPASGSYRFQVTADDGIRVWINAQLVVDKWTGGSGNVTYLTPEIYATAGARLAIVIEHYDLTGDSSVKLKWVTPGATTYYLPVPIDRLYAQLPNVAPTVSLSGAAQGTVGVGLALTATAADSDGTVASVAFYDGASLIATLSSSPFNIVWTPATPGVHNLSARATDNQGASTTSAVLAVNVAPPPNVPPTVNLSAPTSGSIGVDMLLVANASDSDGTLTQVEFFAGAGSIGTVSSAPFQLLWNPSSTGVYSLSARATDNSGASTTSAAVNVSINPPPVGTGLRGQYFANPALSGAAVLTRTEAVSFVWASVTGTASPGAGVPSDNWSVRWTGFVQFPVAGTYTLRVVSDDGIRVRINGQLVIDRWAGAGNTTFTLAPMNANVGNRVAIEIEHYDGSGDSTVKLRWQAPGSAYWYDIPAAQLLSD